MKNSFSNALLCGVLASSFLLVNCQKAPSRSTKAEAGPSAKPAVAAKTATCSPEALSAIELRANVIKNIKAITEKAKDTITPVEIESLKKLKGDLEASTSEVVLAIQALKVGDAAAEACDQADPKDATKKLSTTVLTELTAENTRILSSIRPLIGETAPALPVAAPSVIAECTSDISEALVARAATLKEINDLIAKNKTAALEAADKSSLEKVVEKLKIETAAVVEKISALKVEEKAADACAAKGATKESAASVAGLKDESDKVEAAASTITGVAVTAAEKIVAEQKLTVSAELGKSLDKSLAEGDLYIVDGKILKGKEDFQKVVAANESSVCTVRVSADALAEKAEVTVMDIKSTENTIEEKTRQLVTIELISVNGGSAYSLLCSVPKGIESAEGARAALGAQVSIVGAKTAGASPQLEE